MQINKGEKMLGAIAGDILGSRFEFEQKKYQDVSKIKLFHKKDKFTDDTVLTLAVADWLLHDIEANYYNDDALKESLAKRFIYWTHRYGQCDIAYGLNYMQWYFKAEISNDYSPYGSFGNGSAMRVSPIGWYFDTLEETLRFAKISADVTHNHPDGEKGALAIAAALFWARNKKPKSFIEQFSIRSFGYNVLIDSFDKLRQNHKWNCICNDTVPQAIKAFTESHDFESSIRLAISYGGDSDTIAAMSGSIAEAFYGIPENVIKYVESALTSDAWDICTEFLNKITVA